MAVFVTELNGIIARIFYADSFAAAKRYAQAELHVCGHYPRLEIHGKPIWDGKDESIKTRKADPHETALFYRDYAQAIDAAEDFEFDMDAADWYSVFPNPVVLNEEKPAKFWSEEERAIRLRPELERHKKRKRENL